MINQTNSKRFWSRSSAIIWGVVAALCTLYGLFALIASIGLAETEKTRALPLAFSIHAATGGISLIAGIFQFNPVIRARFVQIHRYSGRAYAISAGLASVSAVTNAMFFDVIPAAKLSFAVLGLIWFGTTLFAYLAIRNGRIDLHREWALRSFSMAFFFVTFSFWVPLVAGGGNGQDASYVVAVTLSWVPNLVIAELWIRRFRKTTGMLTS